MNPRHVEIFSAACPNCTEAIALVERLVSADDVVAVHDLHTPDGRKRAHALGIHRVPTIVIDGTPAECCTAGPPNEGVLRSALEARD